MIQIQINICINKDKFCMMTDDDRNSAFAAIHIFLTVKCFPTPSSKMCKTINIKHGTYLTYSSARLKHKVYTCKYGNSKKLTH